MLSAYFLWSTNLRFEIRTFSEVLLQEPAVAGTEPFDGCSSGTTSELMMFFFQHQVTCIYIRIYIYDIIYIYI